MAYTRTNATNRPPVPKRAQLLLRRHASDADLADAHEQQIGQVRDAGSAHYRITAVLLDDLGRLIGVGELIEPGVSAEPAEPMA